MSAARALLLVAVCVPGCAKGPAEHVCPAELAAGDLVVTELRGAQSAAATDTSQWIELFNTSGVTVDLIGLHLRIRKVDGSSEDRVIVRRSVTVLPDDYVVIGLGIDATRPAHLDYAAGGDTGTSLLENAALEVDLCDDTADEIRYVGLPSTGTWSYGETPPTALGNDPAAAWCIKATPPEGTPGAFNPPCP